MALGGSAARVAHPLPTVNLESPLTWQLQEEVYPPGFRLPKLSLYRRDSDPAEFVKNYALAIEASGGSTTTMAKFFPLALDDVA